MSGARRRLIGTPVTTPGDELIASSPRPRAAWLDDAGRLRWARLALGAAFGAGLLIAAPLYLSNRAYPLAPVLEFAPAVPAPLDRVLLVALLLALAGVAVAPKPRLWAWAALVLASVVALGDQSRWQPWFYQYVLMLLALALARSTAETLAAWRFVLVALYVFSGLQKLNVTFATRLFPWMLEPLTGPRSGDPGPWLIAVGVAAALVETAIGLCLLSARLRNPGVVAAVLTHGLVLTLLGPLGRGQNHVIWPWNVTLATLAVLLFWRADATTRSIALPRRAGVHAVVIVLTGILPVASFLGWWDLYLSGALYSGNIPAGFVAMNAQTAEHLPPEARRHLETAGDKRILDLWEWSMAELHAPSYPEPRVLRHIGAELCRRINGPPDVVLAIFHRPAVLGGEREITREDCAALVSR